MKRTESISNRSPTYIDISFDLINGIKFLWTYITSYFLFQKVYDCFLPRKIFIWILGIALIWIQKGYFFIIMAWAYLKIPRPLRKYVISKATTII